MTMSPSASLQQARAKSFDFGNLPDDYFESPYASFAALRDYDPVHWNSDGTVLLTRYADVAAVWLDMTASVDKSELFSKKFGPGPLLEHHTTTMLFRDPPDHQRLRKIVNPFFSTTGIQPLKSLVDGLIDDLIEEARARREIDFVRDFAFRIPMTVICRILGAPSSDSELLHQLGMRIIFPLNPGASEQVIAEGHQAVKDFKAYLADLLRHKRSHMTNPSDDIMGTLVDAQQSGSGISDDEILHMCILLLNGGHETTTNTLSIGLLELLQRPGAIAEFRHAPEVGLTAADELIRFITPIQLQGRRLTRPKTLPGGTELPAGTEVILCPASANRDASAFPRPEQIDLWRTPNKHFSFGASLHLCIGRFLARMEIAATFPKLFKAFNKIEQLEPVAFNRNVRFRGIDSLPVRMEPQ